MLFGKSGLGKSSLLQAGLAPELRRSAFIPIYIRLHYGDRASSLGEQVVEHIRATMDREGIEGPRPTSRETLWEYFHAKDADWWDAENQLVKPVLMFDQFEELLNFCQASTANIRCGQEFLNELEDLLENRVPETLEKRMTVERGLSQNFDRDRTRCHVIFSLREDYLADLEGLHERLRLIMRNRYRLLPMNRRQAVEVVLKPGAHLVEPPVAEKIVRFVSSADRQLRAEDANLQVEPALLSVVLQELNNRRIAGGLRKIPADFLGGNQARDILQHFYERGLEGLGPEVVNFMVDHLLTASGARNRIAEEDALTKPGITPEVISLLIDRRMIQRQTSENMKWLELTHDTLANVVHRSRAEIRQRRELEAAAAREKEIHDNLMRSRKLVAVFATFAVVTLFAFSRSFLDYRKLRGEKQLIDNQNRALDAATRSNAAANQSLQEKNDRLVADAEHASKSITEDLWKKIYEEESGNVGEIFQEVGQLDLYANDPRSPTSIRQQRVLGDALGASALYLNGYIDEGVEVAQRALDAASAESSMTAESRLGELASEYALGRGLGEQGRYYPALQHLQKALALAADLKDAPIASRSLELKALTLVSLGRVRGNHLDYKEASAILGDALRLTGVETLSPASLATGDSKDPILIYAGVDAYVTLGQVRSNMAAVAHGSDVLEALERAQTLANAMRTKDPGNAVWASLYIDAAMREASAMQSMGTKVSALPLIQQALPVAESTEALDSGNRRNAYLLGRANEAAGEYYTGSDSTGSDSVKASTFLGKAIAAFASVSVQEPGWALGKHFLADAEIKAALLMPEETREDAQKKREMLLKAVRVDTALAKSLGDGFSDFVDVADANEQMAFFEASQADREKQRKAAREEHADRQEAASYLRNSRNWFNQVHAEKRKIPWGFAFDATLHEATGRFILTDASQAHARQVEYDKAIQLYRKLINDKLPFPGSYYSGLGGVYIDKGNAYAELRDYKTAREAFQQSLAVFDEGISYLGKLGDGTTELESQKIQNEINISYQWRQHEQFDQSCDVLQISVKELRSWMKNDMLRFTVMQEWSSLTAEIKNLQQDVQGRKDEVATHVAQLSQSLNSLGELLYPADMKSVGADAVVLAASQSWPADGLVPGAWIQLTPQEASQEKAKLLASNLQLGFATSSILRFRKLPLGFYRDGILYEAECRREDGSLAVMDYVRSQDDIFVLDGTHNITEAFDSTTDGKSGFARTRLQLDSVERAAQLMHFFMAAIQDQDGTRRIIDNPSDLHYAPDAMSESREKVNRLVKPFHLQRNQDGRWIGDGTLSYGDNLVYAIFMIDPDRAGNPVFLALSTNAAVQQPLLNEHFVSKLRVLSDLSHRLTLLSLKENASFEKKDWPSAEAENTMLLELVKHTDSLSDQDRAAKLVSMYGDRESILRFRLDSELDHRVWPGAEETARALINAEAEENKLTISAENKKVRLQERITQDSALLTRLDSYGERDEEQNLQPFVEHEELLKDKLLASFDLPPDKRKESAAGWQTDLSWGDLKRKDFAQALARCEAGLKIDPTNLPLQINQAHALLFLGRWPEAEAIYRKNIGKKVGQLTWQAIILDDLKNLTASGLTDPHFAEVRAMMTNAQAE